MPITKKEILIMTKCLKALASFLIALTFMLPVGIAAASGMMEYAPKVSAKASDTDFKESDIVTLMVKLDEEPALSDKCIESESTKAKSALIEDAQDEVIATIEHTLLNDQPLDILYRYSLLFSGFSFKGEFGLIEQIKKLPLVEDCYVSPGWIMQRLPETEGTKLSGSIPFINADELWELGYTGKGKTVAVIDTGLVVTHPNFSVAPPDPHFNTQNLTDILNSYDLLAEQKFSGTLTAHDVYQSQKIAYTFDYVMGSPDVDHAVADNDHGTHVTSIAAGHDSSHKGVAYDAQLVIMNVFEDEYEDWAIVLAALEDCVYLGVDSLNMSFGDDCGLSTGGDDIDRVFQLLHEAGVNCIAAAGNSETVAEGNLLNGKSLATNPDNGAIASPATYSVPLAVAACDNSAEVCYFSSWGPTSDLKIKPEIMAPGSWITAATDPDYSGSQYGVKSGTSMASPHVAGAAALLDEYVSDTFPNLSQAEQADMVNTLLMSTAIPAIYSGDLPYSPRLQGAGVIDLIAAASTGAYIEVGGSVRPKLEIGDDPERTGVFTFSFDVVNFGNETLTFDISANVQTENVTGSSPTYYMAEAPLSLMDHARISAPSSVTVPAGERRSIEITVDVSSAREFLDARFKNGIYIEGYISLDGTTDLSVPYLGFYGGWDEPPVIEPVTYWDEITGNAQNATWGVNLVAHTSASNVYRLGENPFIDSSDFFADRISISPNGDGKLDSVNTVETYMLRAARDFTYTISDDSGNIIYEKICPLVRKTCSYYSERPVGEMPGTAIDPFTGEGLYEGDTVMFEMAADLNFEGFDPENCQKSSWSFPVTIDTTPPEINYWKIDDGKFTLYVTDAHYTAYVGVYANSSYTQLIAETAITQTRRNAMSLLSFDIGNRDTVYVKVGDYAMNVETAQLTGEGGSYDHIELDGIALDPANITLYEGYSATIGLILDPIDANAFTTEWYVDDPAVVDVNAYLCSAELIGLTPGTTTLTCIATNIDTGETLTASAAITVNDYPNISEAANAAGGTIDFTSTGTYPWQVVFLDDRVAIRSTNSGIANSESTVRTTLTLSQGDKLHFDWKVSSERNYDSLRFMVNGREEASISGDNSWTEFIYTAPGDGVYSFEWSYEKDMSVDSYDDAGFIDEVYISYFDEPEYSLGDVDEDGHITAIDALVTLRFSLDILDLTPTQIAAADFNQSGDVTAMDALLILRHIL